MKLSVKQTQALDLLEDNKTKELLFGGSAGGGKSALGCYWQLKNRFKYPGTRGLIGRSKLKTLKETTLNTFFEIAGMQGLRPDVHFHYNAQYGLIDFPNKSQIILKDLFSYPSDPNFDELGSLEITDAFIDEAPQVTAKAKQIVRSRIRYKLDEYGLAPKLLMTCNPSKNWTYSEFYKPYRDGNLPTEKKFIQSLVQDNPFISKTYIDNLMQLDNVTKERLLYGNWEYDDDPSALVDYDAICDLFTNDHVKPGEKRISADLALQGRDRFIGGHWEGLIAHVDIDKEKSTAREIEIDIRNLKTSKGVPNSRIVADSDGIGAYLESYINNIVQFHGNEKAKDSQYANLKSECGFKLAEVITNREMKIICTKEQEERIKTELSVCLKRDRIDSDESKKRLIPKDKMKELLGHSPDYFDFLLMGMVFEVKPSRSKPKVTFSSFHR